MKTLIQPQWQYYFANTLSLLSIASHSLNNQTNDDRHVEVNSFIADKIN